MIYSLVSENKLLQHVSMTADGCIEVETQRLGDIKAKIEECLIQLAVYGTVISEHQPKLKDFEKPLREAHAALQSPADEQETLLIILVLSNEIQKIIKYHRGDDTVTEKLRLGQSTMRRQKKPDPLDIKASRRNFPHTTPINQDEKMGKDSPRYRNDAQGDGNKDQKDVVGHEDDGNNINDILAMLGHTLINYDPEGYSDATDISPI